MGFEMKIVVKEQENPKAIFPKKLEKFIYKKLSDWPADWARRFRQTLRPASKYNRNIIIEHTISLVSFISLCNVARNLQFFPAAVISGEQPVGFAFSSKGDCRTHAPRLIHNVVSIYLGKPQLTLPTRATMRDLHTHLASEIRPALLTYVEHSDHVQSILEFVDFTPNAHNSDDLSTQLLFLTTRFRRSNLEQSLLTEAQSDMHLTTPRSANTWKFNFFGNSDTYYFWDKDTREKPLRSQPLPGSLRKMFSSLVESGMPPRLSDCLLALYDKEGANLAAHCDKFAESYFGEREHVLLAFSGLPRTLAFQPMSQRTSVDNFLFPVRCSDNITVELTPLTNSIFVHAKARSREKGISYTFSWRRGVPFKHLRRFNRKVYLNALKHR